MGRGNAEEIVKRRKISLRKVGPEARDQKKGQKTAAIQKEAEVGKRFPMRRKKGEVAGDNAEDGEQVSSAACRRCSRDDWRYD